LALFYYVFDRWANPQNFPFPEVCKDINAVCSVAVKIGVKFAAFVVAIVHNGAANSKMGLRSRLLAFP